MATSIKVNGAGAKKYQFPNGMKWELGYSDVYDFNTVKYGNGVWVAGSDSVGLFYSIDGKTWTQIVNAGKTADICYANGTWVVAGSSNLFDGLGYSLDGKIWNYGGLESDFNCVYYGNGIWVAGSGGSLGLYYSTTGKTWTKSNITSGNFKDVYYANGIWVAGSASNKGLYYSTDGKSWTQSNITTGQGYDIANANGMWIVGFYSRRGAFRVGVYYSTDGKTWTQSNLTSTDDYSPPYFMFDKWVIGEQGEGSIYYSMDGKTWTQSNLSGYTFSTGNSANGIALMGGTGYNGGNLFYSFDGKNWTKGTSLSSESVSLVGVYDLCAANGLWVAATDAGLYYSPTWEPTIPAGDYMFSDSPTMISYLENIAENIPFTSNDTSYSKMTLQYQT